MIIFLILPINSIEKFRLLTKEVNGLVEDNRSKTFRGEQAWEQNDRGNV